MKRLTFFLAKVNWRQAAIHFIATWFFITAFNVLACLWDTHLMNVLNSLDVNRYAEVLEKENITPAEMINYSRAVNGAWFLGLLSAFLISITITLRRHWPWINAVLPFVLACLIYYYLFVFSQMTGWYTAIYPRIIPLNAGWHLAAGLVLLSLGCFLFFSARINRYIARCIPM